MIRALTAADGPAAADLVAACWAEYPGIVADDITDERPLILRFADEVAAAGGAAFAHDAGGLAGIIGVRPHGDAWEIVRLYVAAASRGGRVADGLLAAAEAYAIARAASRFVLHSDTRFARAHAFYERHGYVRHGGLRVLHDRSASLEFGYEKPVRGVRALDAAAAASAVRPLAALLVACMDAGAPLGFHAPLSPKQARAHWIARAREVAQGGATLLAGWSGAALRGTVSVIASPRETDADQAEIAQLMVHPQARRDGLGRALVEAAEAQALAQGRPALMLFTTSGTPAQALWDARGYELCGRLPGTEQLADGTRADALLFFKRLR